MPNATGGKGVPRYVKQTPEQQQQYYEQLQSANAATESEQAVAEEAAPVESA